MMGIKVALVAVTFMSTSERFHAISYVPFSQEDGWGGLLENKVLRGIERGMNYIMKEIGVDET
jgi:hypothetical protein